MMFNFICMPLRNKGPWLNWFKISFFISILSELVRGINDVNSHFI